jgi:hypothetical protein
MTDTASLQNLHDIVVPGPVASWPPAPGWYLVIAIAGAVLLVSAWRGWKHWRRNRYRGQALRELDRIRRGQEGANARQLPELLKRAALSAWPREEVAALAGPDWHRFLDDAAGMECFGSHVGPVLDRLAWSPGPDGLPSEAECAAAMEAVRSWLKNHRAPREQA